MKSMQLVDQLTIFTRYPEPGLTKTRLIGALGEDGAAALQKELTERTVQKIDQLTKTSTIEPVIYFENGNLASMQNWLGPDRLYKPQGDGNLGEKLKKAFGDAFSAGAQRVVTIGCDCPGLTNKHIGMAFDALYLKDLVLGPATDGGYYLIGINRPLDALFEDIPWSTNKVFETTVSLAQQLGLSIEILEELHDVDRPADLEYINYHSDPERN
jgi:rSAM/selenodomain-associated transferase 1